MSLTKLRTGALVVVLSLTIVSGVLLLSNGIPGRNVPVDREYLLGQVIARLEHGYIDSTTTAQMYGLAMIGMLRKLGDPHATYIPAGRLALLRERTSETAVGAGLEIDERDGSIAVVSPLAGSPADRAGVRAGDRIVQVNGDATRGLSAEEVRLALQGNAGTIVTLAIERTGVAQPITLKLTRELPPMRPVRASFMLSGDIGYIKLNRISRATGAAMVAAIDSLLAGRMETLIVDLRGNSDGTPEDGVAVADLFLPAGSALGSIRGRTARDAQGFLDRSASKWDSLEVIVLVDAGTANASEITAGALQDLDRALIVGRPTYGKASRQQRIALSDGGAIVITTSRWYTPLGRSIDAAPDAPRARADSPGDTSSREAEFTTKSGRVVRGGGGIRPDLIVRKATRDVAALPSDLYEPANAREIVLRDASIRIAVSLARQAHGQMELFSRALAAEAAGDDEGGR